MTEITATRIQESLPASAGRGRRDRPAPAHHEARASRRSARVGASAKGSGGQRGAAHDRRGAGHRVDGPVGRRASLIVLDTHVLIWLAVTPARLSADAAGAIELDPERAISTVSAQEIAYLVMRRRMELDRPLQRWIGDALSEHGVEPLAPDFRVALRAGSLPADDFPGDPADRLIYATAVEHGARLVSADQRLRALDPARVVW